MNRFQFLLLYSICALSLFEIGAVAEPKQLDATRDVVARDFPRMLKDREQHAWLKEALSVDKTDEAITIDVVNNFIYNILFNLNSPMFLPQSAAAQGLFDDLHKKLYLALLPIIEKELHGPDFRSSKTHAEAEKTYGDLFKAYDLPLSTEEARLSLMAKKKLYRLRRFAQGEWVNKTNSVYLDTKKTAEENTKTFVDSIIKFAQKERKDADVFFEDLVTNKAILALAYELLYLDSLDTVKRLLEEKKLKAAGGRTSSAVEVAAAAA